MYSVLNLISFNMRNNYICISITYTADGDAAKNQTTYLLRSDDSLTGLDIIATVQYIFRSTPIIL